MKAYGFMESVIPDTPVSRWTATSIACPNPACSAPVDTACDGRCCPERIAEAVERARRGELAPAPVSASVRLSDDGLAGCTRCRSYNLRVIACDDHRCAAMIQGRGACRTARTEGSRYCYVHRCVIEENDEQCTKKAINNRKCADHTGR